MQKTILTLTAIASIFIMSCNTSSSPKNFKSAKENLSVTEASLLLKDSALLIDVREPEEVAEQSYDVKEVKNIPLDDLEKHLAEIPKNKQVIVACRSGKRSSKAFDILKKNGFINIANMDGGMNAWEEAGLPTKIGSSSTDIENEKSTDCSKDSSGKCKSGDKACCSKTNVKNTNTTKTNQTRLEIYAFHGTRQCATCKNMKANTKITLEKYFSEQLKNGSIVFSIIDVDDSKNEKLAEKFQATGTALMANNIVNGKENILNWSDFAFDKANDADKFIPELKSKIDALLKK